MDAIRFKFTGQVVIRDQVTGAVILSRFNAVHPQNLVTAVGRALSNDSSGVISRMVFGSGGTTFNSTGALIYRSPVVTGVGAALYRQTYSVNVDEQDNAVSPNSVTSSPAPSSSTVITVPAQLNANEPAGQAVTDGLGAFSAVTPGDPTTYVFDELGLTTSDGLLLSHLIFAPIEKAANRAFLITYTVTGSI